MTLNRVVVMGFNICFHPVCYTPGVWYTTYRVIHTVVYRTILLQNIVPGSIYLRTIYVFVPRLANVVAFVLRLYPPIER